jgi:hypothetical protein
VCECVCVSLSLFPLPFFCPPLCSTFWPMSICHLGWKIGTQTGTLHHPWFSTYSWHYFRPSLFCIRTQLSTDLFIYLPQHTWYMKFDAFNILLRACPNFHILRHTPTPKLLRK